MRLGLGLLIFLGACGSSEASSGPIARIHQFTGCEVPPGAVRVHEQLEVLTAAVSSVRKRAIGIPARCRSRDVYIRPCVLGDVSGRDQRLSNRH